MKTHHLFVKCYGKPLYPFLVTYQNYYIRTKNGQPLGRVLALLPLTPDEIDGWGGDGENLDIESGDCVNKVSCTLMQIANEQIDKERGKPLENDGFPKVRAIYNKRDLDGLAEYLRIKISLFSPNEEGEMEPEFVHRDWDQKYAPNLPDDWETRMPDYYEGQPPKSHFHKRGIMIKGKLGEFTKIEEEVDEMREALEQNNKPLALIECFDLLGAVHHFLAKYNLTLEEAVPYVMQYDAFRESLKEKK